MSTNPGQLELPGITTTNYPAIDYTTERNATRFYATKCFAIPPPLVQSHFSKYYLLYWSGSYLLEQIKQGAIAHNGIVFAIEYKRGLTRGRIIANMQDQYALSFREPQLRLALLPVVIISATNRKP
jgi:hypothetical protein